ncbi:MAG: hypothetical protein ACYTGC_09860, partial [Planctomycetota bacterium]
MSSSASSSRQRTGAAAAAALSGHLDTRTAALEVADRLAHQLDGPCDLMLVFASFHHRAAMSIALDDLRRTLQPRVLLGATAESVLGEAEEREGRAGLSALALRLPDVRIEPWHITPEQPLPDLASDNVRRHLHLRRGS